MANTKSAQKAARQTVRRTAVNKSRRSEMRTYVRKVEEALATKDPKAAVGSWGGHAVPVVAYDTEGLTCVTWGALKKMTWSFWLAYAEEAYAVVSEDFISANGLDPTGLDLSTLLADLTAVSK